MIDEELIYAELRRCSLAAYGNLLEMANFAAATYCPAFDLLFGQVEDGLQALLREKGLHRPERLAYLVPKRLSGTALEKRLTTLLRELGGGDRAERWTPEATHLLLAARGEALELAERAGRLSGAQISADTAQRQRERQDHTSKQH